MSRVSTFPMDLQREGFDSQFFLDESGFLKWAYSSIFATLLFGFYSISTFLFVLNPLCLGYFLTHFMHLVTFGFYLLQRRLAKIKVLKWIHHPNYFSLWVFPGIIISFSASGMALILTLLVENKLGVPEAGWLGKWGDLLHVFAKRFFIPQTALQLAYCFQLCIGFQHFLGRSYTRRYEPIYSKSKPLSITSQRPPSPSDHLANAYRKSRVPTSSSSWDQSSSIPSRSNNPRNLDDYGETFSANERRSGQVN
jgi:hypothetical protein